MRVIIKNRGSGREKRARLPQSNFVHNVSKPFLPIIVRPNLVPEVILLQKGLEQQSLWWQSLSLRGQFRG